MKNIVEINIEEDNWNNVDFAIEEILLKALQECEKYDESDGKCESYMISVCLSNNANIAAINQQFRSKNKPTNVLSFPSGGELINENSIDYDFLGDIIFAYDVIKKESIEQEKKFEDHFFHLSIHSILHLLEYDHIEEGEAEEMENIEIAILAKHNIANPYL